MPGGGCLCRAAAASAGQLNGRQHTPERLSHWPLLLQVMLLANVTISQEGAEQLLQLGQAKLAGLHCAMLLQVGGPAAAGCAPPPCTAAAQGLAHQELPPAAARRPGLILPDLACSGLI